MNTHEWSRHLISSIKDTLQMVIDAETPEDVIAAKEMAEYHLRRCKYWEYKCLQEDSELIPQNPYSQPEPDAGGCSPVLLLLISLAVAITFLIT